jgi:hypothetical protein
LGFCEPVGEKARVNSLLARTAENEVSALPENVFRAHAAAGPLFDAETVEVV